MLSTEQGADTDAHRQEGQRRLHDAFNRTEAETYADKQERQRRLHDGLTEQEAETDAYRQEGQRRLYDAFNIIGGWEGCSQIGKTEKTT